ncbi:MAG: 5'/3'-nucleotidase SurE [Tissierellaceae bacterium]
MKILLTNDDGIMAEGIYILAKELEKNHEVIIIAPESEKSAQSHAITLSQSLVVKEVKLKGLKSKAYSVSGTPADCVRAGLSQIAEDVDMVFSGINRGLNAGMDILYSGTVSAAIEANIHEKPSIAVSAELVGSNCDFETAAKYACEILERGGEEYLSSNTLLNINVPYRESLKPKGIKVCKIGEVIYDCYIMELGENGENTVRVNGRKDTKFGKDTDRYFLSEGYVTLTPLNYDLTNFKLIDMVKNWIL